jgi:DedD protein
MRDGSRIREKIEIALDGRQVVTVVLACAVVLGLVFWLGVNVGRDLSAKGPVAPADPIARVDQKAEKADDHITFPERLVEPLPGAAARPAAPAEARAPAAPAAPAGAPAPAEKAPEKPASDPAPSAAADIFTVQAGALPSQSEADAMVQTLARKGLSAYVVVADLPGKGTYYRVRVGRFGSKDEADRYLVDFKRETGMDGFVTQVGR